MQQSIVRRAAHEFARGNYPAALGLYLQLAQQLGEKNFKANIYLCQKKLTKGNYQTHFGEEALRESCNPYEFDTPRYYNYECTNKGPEYIVKLIKDQFGTDPARCAKKLIKIAKLLGDANNYKAKYIITKAAKNLTTNLATLRALFWAAQQAKELEVACDSIHEIEKLLGSSISHDEAEKLRKMKISPAYQLSVLHSIEARKTRTLELLPQRICYVLHNSLPYSSGGYATRSHGVAGGLINAGFELIALTRPGFPLDIKPELQRQDIPKSDLVESIRYLRTLDPPRSGKSMLEYVISAADALEIQFKNLRPGIIIAASNHVTGLPALIAARRLGIHFIYEVRGLWEITRMSRESSFQDAPAFAVQRILEAAVCNEADHVFTLTEAMREELIDRGVSKSKIDLLPNSCDPSRFIPRERDQRLSQQLGIPLHTPVIGYIGTFVDYEGLEDLASACALLKKRCTEFRLLLVGNENASGQDRGPITEKIADIAASNGYTDWLIMPGRVPHKEVGAYYSLLDVCPFPRKPWPVCEMVSPMKPLEALAMEKAVVVSNVKALREMIKDGETGLCFEKGSVESLAEALEKLVKDPKLRATFGQAGRSWVERERTWRQVGEKVAAVLKHLDLTAGLRDNKAADAARPTWWAQIPGRFSGKCTYMPVQSWELGEPARLLRRMYIKKFGAKSVDKRIPVINWSRADICVRQVPGSLPVLDVGSGLGEFVNLFALVNGETKITSVDVKDYDLWFDATGRVERVYKSIYDLSPAEVRDVVTCFEVIEHLPPARLREAVAILRSLARVKLFVSVPFMEPLPLYKGHFTQFDADLLLELFPDARFTVFGKGANAPDKVLAWIMCEIDIRPAIPVVVKEDVA